MTDAAGEAPAPQTDGVDVVKATGLSPRTITLLLLLVVYISNYADRQILNVLAVQIMADMQISKSAFGLLSGLSFALFYATLGIPKSASQDEVKKASGSSPPPALASASARPVEARRRTR